MKKNLVLSLAAAALMLVAPAWPLPAENYPYPEKEAKTSGAPASRKLNCTLVQKQDMLARFLRYVAIESGSSEKESITPGQIEMANLLEADVQALGAKVFKSEWQYVYVDIPSNIEKDVPVLGFSCHLDYTPEAPGEGIKPTVLAYSGGDIVLADGSVISPANPDGVDLPGLVGKTLIHTDGTTLLGGDDKNGCTILISLIETLVKSDMKHGQVQFVFCPNEDVGRAAEHIDTAYFSPDILFDVDSKGGSEVFDCNFTAQQLAVRFIGHPAHPQEAKAKKMGDALAAAATYIASVPLEYRPERTEGKDGYIQHYSIVIEESKVDYQVLSRIRYFDKNEGELFNKIIKESLEKVNRDFPYVKTEVIINELLYDNVAYTMHPSSRAVLDRASTRSDVKISVESKRAGTTAALFVAKGLKGGMGIFSGQHNAHSVHEYSCLEEMMDSYRLLLYVIDEVTSLDNE